jgi:hypothetical protein
LYGTGEAHRQPYQKAWRRLFPQVKRNFDRAIAIDTLNTPYAPFPAQNAGIKVIAHGFMQDLEQMYGAWVALRKRDTALVFLKKNKVHV